MHIRDKFTIFAQTAERQKFKPMKNFVFIYSEEKGFKAEIDFKNGPERSNFAGVSVPSLYNYKASALADIKTGKTSSEIVPKTNLKKTGGVILVQADTLGKAIDKLVKIGFKEAE